MTIGVIFEDGCEDYSIVPGQDISDKITNGARFRAASGVLLGVEARTGSYSFRLNSLSGMSRSLKGDRTQFGVASSTMMENLPNVNNSQWTVLGIANSFNRFIILICISPTGRVVIRDRAGAQLAVSTREIAAGRHNHFEVRFKNSSGVTVRTNGKFDTTYTGAMLSSDQDNNLAERPAAAVLWGTASGAITPSLNGIAWVDDIVAYTWEDGDDYIGQYGVYYLKPIADAAETDWQLSSGVDGWPLINTVAPLGDTSFIFSQVPGDKSSFNVEPLPVNIVSVLAVQPTVYARTTDSGEGRVDLGVNSAGTEEMSGDDIPLQSDYGYNDIPPIMVDPDTSNPWDPLFLPAIVLERTV